MPLEAAHRPLRAVCGALTTTVAVSVPVFLVGGLAVQIGGELGFSAAGTGLAMAAYFGASALASMPAGALVERHGAALISRCGIALSIASLLAVALAARSLATLVGILVIGAVGNAMGQLAGNASLARRVPVRRQGLSFGVKQAAIPICTLLSGAAVPVVALTFGWRWAFAGAAALCLPAFLLAPDDTAAGASFETARRSRRTSRALLVVGVAAALGAAGAKALGAFLVLSAAERGVSPGLAGAALTVGSVICVGARVLGGWQADRHPRHQVAVVAGLLAGGSVGLLLLAAPGPAPLLAGVLVGFGLGWSWPGLMNFAVVRLHPRAPATASAVTLTGAQTGACLGPLGLGAVAQAAGYPAMWITASLAMAGAAALMVLSGRALRPHVGGRSIQARTAS
ncbi:MFS transporter [Actinoplanes sp. NPDC024001]|uniref:MFS transporter n=1 Tax=Actinoplanes sp. NPDC024001 TaxID=3154598 RepID=UPI0033CF7841